MGYLSTIPRLTSALVSKHKPNPEATAKGHLDRRRQGIDSTITVPVVPTKPVTTVTAIDEPSYDDDIQNIPDEATVPIDDDHTVYVKLFNTADFDSSSRFPIPSSGSRYSYHLVSCYNGNIHVETTQSPTSTAYIAAYELTFQHWSRYGSVPSFVRLDNETSHELENFLVNDKKVTFQYFPTGTHRANRAECYIRTWKNHFIATLATTSLKFPISQWHKLLPLAELTLNLPLTMASQSRDLSLPRPNGRKVRLPRTPYRTSWNRNTDPRATRITWQLGKSRSARLLSWPCSAPLSLTPRICDRHLRHSLLLGSPRRI